MTTRWYYKELPENQLWLSSGARFTFEWLETSDAWLISELDAAIANQIGGVIAITKEQYDEGIKKKSEVKSPNSLPRRQEINPLQHQFNMSPRGFPGARAVAGGVRSQPVAVPAAELPDPLQVPDPSQFKMPSVGKMP